MKSFESVHMIQLSNMICKAMEQKAKIKNKNSFSYEQCEYMVAYSIVKKDLQINVSLGPVRDGDRCMLEVEVETLDGESAARNMYVPSLFSSVQFSYRVDELTKRVIKLARGK